MVLITSTNVFITELVDHVEKAHEFGLLKERGREREGMYLQKSPLHSFPTVTASSLSCPPRSGSPPAPGRSRTRCDPAAAPHPAPLPRRPAGVAWSHGRLPHAEESPPRPKWPLRSRGPQRRPPACPSRGRARPDACPRCGGGPRRRRALARRI